MSSLKLSRVLAVSSVVWALGILPGQAAIASITFTAGWGQWVVADSAESLDSQLAYLGDREGGFRVNIRCDGTGWVAYYFSGGDDASGWACGFPEAQSAEEAAYNECVSAGGTNCYRVHARYDDGTFMMDRDDLNPIYNLVSAYDE